MANKKISQLTAVASVSDNDVFPVVQGAATLKAKISDIKAYLPQASSTLTGLLTNTDWSTFNNKQNALTLGNLTESTSSVLTITGGTGSIIGSGLSIQVKQASASQAGYLSSTDWSTFNSKQGSLTLTTTGTSGAATLVGTTLNIPQYPGNALTSLNGQTGATQTFSTGTTGTDFSISSVANDHKFSFPSASASARGLLTSTDWSTFNSKEPALTKGNLTEATSSVLTITGGTGAVIGSGLTIAVTRSTALADGYLKASDFSTFAAKQDAITLTTTGTSGAATLVGSTLNIPQYSAGGGTVTSVTGTSPIASSGGTTPAISIADAVADGSTKGAAAFNASDFNSTSGVISIDYTNGQAASASNKGFLTATDWTTFNNKGTGIVSTVSGTSPINTSGVDNITITVDKAKANDSTLGVATFRANDFDDDGAGLISIDYTNATSASSGQKGFLTASDWSTFNGKQNAITLTTTGTSGAATLVGSTLNIPQYSGGSGVTSVTGTSPISSSGGTTPAISIANAKADASTKGAATFKAADFNDDGSGLISIDYTNGQASSASNNGFLSSTDWSTFNGKQDTANDIISAFGLLGSSFKGINLASANNEINNSNLLTSQTLYFVAIYIPKSCTITGVKWYQATSGSYTANNYNGVGLYSYSSGTLTLLASSTNDGNIWKATSLTYPSKAFSSTYSAAKGIYFIGFLYSSSAQTQAPAIGIATNNMSAAAMNYDFTNSAMLLGNITSQTSLPSTQAMSGLSTSNSRWMFQLY